MTASHPANHARRRNVAIVVVAVLIVLVVAGGYGLWYLFLRPSGPAAVSSESLVLPSAAASSPLPSGGLAGTWNVDTSIGSSADFDRLVRRLPGPGAARQRSGPTRPSAGRPT